MNALLPAKVLVVSIVSAWLLALIILLVMPQRPRKRVVARLGGFVWTREDFCRGWLITGDTGSGKTRSGITPLLHQVFTNEPTWGGLCIDDKGLYWETLSAMAKHFGRENDLILLQVRPEGAGVDWKPRHTYNLTSDITIPFNTFAKAVVDTASSLGQSGDKGFFRNQAQTHIATALETLRLIGADATLENVYHLLLDERDLEDAITDLSNAPTPTPRHCELIAHFRNRYLSQPPEQLGGVRETIANYLQAFITPEIAKVFCPGANTFDFADMDHGKIICVAMPQKFQVERRYVNTFLKMLFYTHALRRFDKPARARRDDNLLILWADEAQRFVSASEEGMSDYNCIDVIREAQATVVAAAQSSTSFVPPLGREKARVFTLNLRNRLIFRAADEDGAVESADFLGKKRGGDIKTVNKNGETAMHGAAYKSLPKMVQYLADNGAKPEVWNQKNKSGWTPVLIAEGFRPGNFKPAHETLAALHAVMKASGITPPPPTPRTDPQTIGYDDGTATPKKKQSP